MLETLKEIILDFQEEKLNTGVKRHLEYKYIEWATNVRRDSM